MVLKPQCVRASLELTECRFPTIPHPSPRDLDSVNTSFLPGSPRNSSGLSTMRKTGIQNTVSAPNQGHAASSLVSLRLMLQDGGIICSSLNSSVSHLHVFVPAYLSSNTDFFFPPPDGLAFKASSGLDVARLQERSLTPHCLPGSSSTSPQLLCLDSY